MDQSNGIQQPKHQQKPAVGVAASDGTMAYTNSTYQTAPTLGTGSPAVAVSSATQPQSSFPASQHQLAYHQVQHLHSSQQQQLQVFWANQIKEIEQTSDFKNHSLPLARIKKVMKSDEDVRMISAEAPVLFAKACEMFILELTLRSWIHTEENKRRTLQKNDIAAAISRTDVFDFLVDIIPRDELKEEGLGVTKGNIPLMGSTPESVPCYYVQPPHPAGPTGIIMGKPVDPTALYPVQQPQPQPRPRPQPPLSFMPWPQSQSQPLAHTPRSQSET